MNGSFSSTTCYLANGVCNTIAHLFSNKPDIKTHMRILNSGSTDMIKFKKDSSPPEGCSRGYKAATGLAK